MTSCKSTFRNHPSPLTLHRSEDTSDWLLTDKASSWPGTYADRGWRYLRNSLEKHDGPHTDFSYSKVVFETLLAFDRSSTPPPWLVQSLEVRLIQ